MSSNSVPTAVFGPGSLYITRTDVATQTPVNIGYAQEFSYDETAEVKELYGQNRYALLTATGTVKATGKIKAATVSGIALNAAMWGQSFTAGQLSLGTASVAIPTSPDTITVPDSGTWDTDLGVVNAATGVPLAKVASGPTTGQYSVASGTYTFNSADAGINVIITFAYTHTALGGQKITIANQVIGSNPTFQLDYSSTLYGASYYVRFFNCTASKLVRAHKLTDFMMPEIDFVFFANAAGNVFEMSWPIIA
jgi:hypothetical protein